MLRNCRILVVEDEYHIAEEVSEALAEEGAEVLGPVATVPDALAIAEGEERINAALLDVNLGGGMIWPVVDLLVGRNVPVVLTTGYDAGSLPERYAHLPRCEKPVALREITSALRRALPA